MTKKLFKKGISPIIATILLIALAVSIGATVISLGGFYYEKFRLEDSTCSEVLINAFELEEGRGCQNYEFKSIFNFYHPSETVVDPDCYKKVAMGKGDVCVASEVLLNYTWSPIKESIR